MKPVSNKLNYLVLVLKVSLFKYVFVFKNVTDLFSMSKICDLTN